METIEPTSTVQPNAEPTFTFIPPTTTSASPPTVVPTNTPIPCDPRTVDFCITDGSFLLQRPIRPPYNDSAERTYPFASTADGTRDPHHGVEFENEFGTPVHAAADGLVLFAGPDDVAMYSPWREYYGNLIVIEHENDLFTLYAHLSKIDVVAGDAVTVGEKIGEVGRSGAAIGSHLHFEVRRGAVEDYFSAVNPELWLTPRQSSGVISISITDGKSNFQRAEITIQRFSSSSELLGMYYLDIYHPSLVTKNENAAIGDLPAGRYRIALIYNGQVYERWVEVESGKLTQVVIGVE
ncbi:MAG TPA: M23 family metallopeptidase [Anaerolineales bacterium]|nr:M23 family metallopeptidase [Anaerolineales bacterium]